MQYRKSLSKALLPALLGLSCGAGDCAADDDGPAGDGGVTNVQIGPGASASSGVIVIDGKVVGGGAGGVVEGSGRAATERRALDDFQELTVEIGADITLKAGSGAAAVIHADDNVIPLIVTETKGRKLTVLASRSFSVSRPVVIELAVPHISSVTVEGSGSLALEGIAERELALNIEGAADLTAQGRVEILNAEINGTGDLHLGALAARSARIAIEGTGDAEVSVSEALEAEINGTGDIRYSGSPRKVSKKINGVGQVRAQAGE